MRGESESSFKAHPDYRDPATAFRGAFTNPVQAVRDFREMLGLIETEEDNR